VLRDLLYSFSCEIRRPSSMNERVDTLSGSLGHLACSLNRWRMGARYRAERIRGRAKPCPTPTLAGKEGGEVVPAVCGVPVSEVVPEEKWHRRDDLSKMGK